MEKPVNTEPVHNLEPPRESRTSIVLNSVGNGMMLGAIPFLGLEAYSLIAKKPLSGMTRGLSIAASAVGAVFGWVFGEREAERLQNYRHQLANEITSLREDVNHIKADTRWQNRIATESHEKETEQASLER